MVKYLFDPRPAHYYIVSERNSEQTERKNCMVVMKTDIHENKQELSGKKGALYPTNFDFFLFISYSGGFDMSTGKPYYSPSKK